jgi:MFS family permease
MGGYLFALLIAYHLHGLNYKKALCVSSGVIWLATVTIAVVIAWIKQAENPHMVWIWVVISAGGMAGAALAFFWPYAMGWASYGYEGKALNRQLGYYNRAWSSSVIIGPFLGAKLAHSSLLASMGLPVLALFVCVLVLVTIRKPSPNAHGYVSPAPPVDEVRAEPVDYRMLCRMARLSLFTCWGSMAVLRSQFALLMTEHHGFSETQYGGVLTVFALCNFGVLSLIGKHTGWHGRALPILLAQIPACLSLLLYGTGRTLPAFYLAAGMHGASLGFAYSAHLYYGAAGKQKRSMPMVIHELTIAMSMIIGSAASGYLVRYGGLFWPYWFGSGLVVLGLFFQTSIWITGLKKTS